ncbi:hypothetical protein RB620_24450 [Paenibacillus sp. LHD-117]|uniref:hypothetical protein n=1 Tax=Paenibacillus sp. LHD-117 TaxID=3071412 RepID=UPI0027E1CD5C|nr:hypothetical protein [Paenibacillus sp. LHD-117]MDQ6422587.1 hypothetical protein [Paenibacillus sp. LHD-117]
MAIVDAATPAGACPLETFLVRGRVWPAIVEQLHAAGGSERSCWPSSTRLLLQELARSRRSWCVAGYGQRSRSSCTQPADPSAAVGHRRRGYSCRSRLKTSWCAAGHGQRSRSSYASPARVELQKHAAAAILKRNRQCEQSRSSCASPAPVELQNREVPR